ncbi:MAG: hypothetical protein ACRCXH_07450 [Shewanella sp.]
MRVISKGEWAEFESLLRVVAPHYRTPAHEIEEIKAAARNDLRGALTSYRAMYQEMFNV